MIITLYRRCLASSPMDNMGVYISSQYLSIIIMVHLLIKESILPTFCVRLNNTNKRRISYII